jgi:2-phosphosulfolactate phosphatase
MILLSTSGTRLICDAYRSDAAYVACLRNCNALVAHLTGRHAKIAVIGAGSRGEFREEDQLCCAWVAAGLLQAGHRAADARTTEIIERWQNAPLETILDGKSAEYLRRTGQYRDLDFILRHINDLDQILVYRHDEIIPTPATH